MSLMQTPLHSIQTELGARFTSFAGWEMPVTYTGVVEEHHVVREQSGVFDVSHMGKVAVIGSDAEALMGGLTTNDVASLSSGESHYALVTDADGIILDDIVIYRRGPESFLFIPNAGRDTEMVDRWRAHREEWDMDVSVQNVTKDYAMFAVQGPDAPAIIAGEAEERFTEVGRFEFSETSLGGVDCLASRTGYTGEDGFELLVRWEDAEVLWMAITGEAVPGCEPCGLGARDTLRTEMGFLLSGQDFHPTENPRTPLEADVMFAVDLETTFVGREALDEAQASGGPDERLVGFVLEERGIPRHGYPILDQGAGPVDGTDTRQISEVTSGTMSPTLEEPIGLAYLPIDYADPGTQIHIEIRGNQIPATVHTTPFIDRQ